MTQVPISILLVALMFLHVVPHAHAADEAFRLSTLVSRNNSLGVTGVAVAANAAPHGTNLVVFAAMSIRNSSVFRLISSEVFQSVVGQGAMEICDPNTPVDFSAQFKVTPNAVAFGDFGRRLLIADHVPSSRVFEVHSADRSYSSATSTYNTIAGSSCNYAPSVMPNNTVANTSIYNPTAILYDDVTGDVYFTQSYSIVRKDAQTGLLSYFIGGPVPGNINETFNTQLEGIPHWNATSLYPSQMALDPQSRELYFTEEGFQMIRRVDLQTGIVTVVIGNFSAPYDFNTSFPPRDCSLANPCHPSNVSLLSVGGLAFYRASKNNNRWLFFSDPTAAVVYRYDLDLQLVSIVAGQILQSVEVDGIPDVSGLHYPTSLAVAFNTLYIADRGLRMLLMDDYIPTPPLPIPQPVVSGTQTTLVVTSVMSGFISPMTAVQAARSSLLLQLSFCDKSLGGPLDTSENILHLAIGDSDYKYYAGSIVGNIGFCLAVLAAHFFLVILYRRRQRVSLHLTAAKSSTRSVQLQQQPQPRTGSAPPSREGSADPLSSGSGSTGTGSKLGSTDSLDAGNHRHAVVTIGMGPRQTSETSVGGTSQASSTGDELCPNILQSAAALRFPGATVFAVMFVLEGTFTASVRLITDDAGAGLIVLAVIGALACIGITGVVGFYMVRQFRCHFTRYHSFNLENAAAVSSKVPKNTTYLVNADNASFVTDPLADNSSFALSRHSSATSGIFAALTARSGVWNETEDDRFVISRLGQLFEDYIPERRWFAVAEMVMCLSCGIIGGVAPSNYTACLSLIVCAAVVYWLFFIILMVLQPFLRKIYFLSAILIAGPQAVSAALILGYVLTDSSNLIGAAQVLTVLSMYASTIRSLIDIVLGVREVIHSVCVESGARTIKKDSLSRGLLVTPNDSLAGSFIVQPGTDSSYVPPRPPEADVEMNEDGQPNPYDAIPDRQAQQGAAPPPTSPTGLAEHERRRLELEKLLRGERAAAGSRGGETPTVVPPNLSFAKSLSIEGSFRFPRTPPLRHTPTAPTPHADSAFANRSPNIHAARSRTSSTSSSDDIL